MRLTGASQANQVLSAVLSLRVAWGFSYFDSTMVPVSVSGLLAS